MWLHTSVCVCVYLNVQRKTYTYRDLNAVTLCMAASTCTLVCAGVSKHMCVSVCVSACVSVCVCVSAGRDKEPEVYWPYITVA